MLMLVTLLLLPCSSAKLSNSVFDFLRETEPTPIVIWHGMGDSCCSQFSMGRIIKILQEYIPGVYVHSIRIGKNYLQDVESSYFGNVNNQIEEVCEVIKNDEKLKNGYHAIGFSQGGQFLRGLAQRCPSPPMKNLVSMGGQQQGVYGLPYCPGQKSFCDSVRKLLDFGAYVGFVQRNSIQAQYWHDPYAEETYKEKSIFLADINNEKVYNETYKKNLERLQKLVLVKFLDDTVVVPKETEWFGYFKEGDPTRLLTMEETRIYLEDRIGLKTLNESGRLHLIAYRGNHMAITESTFVNDILEKYLR
ncbi:unnamed protein product [Enterobius vermicularis]|uniref:Palmitoyl-protein thioesterase 1 n=1 Tax=Enterobius vermicularis TaxID=51028 RepID=A0A0N4V5P8_ENTVE|nr:unnamed protein product [Enterobius vermicularis]